VKKAEFIGYMGVEVGKPLALYNVGVDTLPAKTLVERGIKIPETPTVDEWKKEGYPSMIGGKACVSGPGNRRLPLDDRGESFVSRTFEG